MDTTQKTAHTPGYFDEVVPELHAALKTLDGIPGTQSAQERIARIHFQLTLPGVVNLLNAAPETAAELERVKAVNVELRKALEDIDDTPISMVNDSETLRFTLRQLQAAARLALSRAEGRG